MTDRPRMETEPSPLLVAHWLAECNSETSILNRAEIDEHEGFSDYDAIRRMLPLRIYDYEKKSEFCVACVSDEVLKDGLVLAKKNIETRLFLEGQK